MRTALLVGGTGPTGPHVLRGLLDRGFEATIYHRGTHEPHDLPKVEHIHGDPHFKEHIESDLGDRQFDVVVAAYGRTRYLAEVLAGRTDHFLSVGGPPRYAGFYSPGSYAPSGLPLPVSEDAPLVANSDASAPAQVQFAAKMVATERQVFTAQPKATHLVYPVVYGPRNVVPLEWSVIKRALDGRPHLLLPDGGAAIHSRGAAENLAQYVLLAIDNPDASKGEVFNCADDRQLSLRQWVEAILVAMRVDIEIVAVPAEVAPQFRAIYIPLSTDLCMHDYLDTRKAQRLLGYRDVVDPLDAVADAVAWYLDNPVDSDDPPAAFIDRFDYDLEDRLITKWRATVADFAALVPQSEIAEFHPMPHPKDASRARDERAR